MKTQLISADEAAACGAKLSQAEVVVSTESGFIKNIQACSLVCQDSGSAINAAIGSELAGKRTFAFCPVSSTNDLYTLSFMRLPAVLATMSVSLGVSGRHDHSEIMSLRDSGCLIFMPEGNQEIIETIIQAYKVCEDAKVMLPAIINIGIPDYREPVQVLNETYAKRFVSKPGFHFLGKKKSCLGLPLDNYAEFKLQQQKAMKNVAELIEKTSVLWHKNNMRYLPMVEKYKADDADFVLIMSGFHSTTAKSAINTLRKEGMKAGLVRVRVVRPWPEEVSKIVEGKKTCMLEQHAAIGPRSTPYSGPVFVSLGRHLSDKDFIDMFRHAQKSGKDETIWLG